MALFSSAGLSVAALLLVWCPAKTTAVKYYVTMDWANSDYTIDLKFLSVAVGTRTYTRTEGGNPQFKVENTRFQNLAKALQPASIRIGGSYANAFWFNPDGRNDSVPATVIDQWEDTFEANFSGGKIVDKWPNKEFSGYQLERVTNFTRDVGWSPLVDINQLLRNGSEWDESNFKLLVEYCRDNGISIGGFQLGNEPSSYSYKYQGRFGVNGSEAVKDWARFHAALRSYPEFNDTEIVGPEVPSLARRGSARTFLNQFLEAGGGNYIDAIGLHQYYFSGSTATQADFKDLNMFDQIKYLAQNATQWRDQYAPGLPIYLTETANSYSGGSWLSKYFIATFIQLDELGMAAKYGISRVHRQTFNSGGYAIVNAELNEPQPHPDYYLAVLFKRLMQGPVLHLSCPTCPVGLRIYANCARREPYSLVRTSTVFYYVNTNNETANIHLNGYGGREMKVFILQSEDPSNLVSANMTLNGNVLYMTNNTLPDMPPQNMTGPNITVPANSVGFIATQQGRAAVCRLYYIDFDANN